MASSGAVRSALRSCFAYRSAFRLASETKAPRSPFRVASNKPLSHATVRCLAELSFCVETMLPYHTVTASALMTSMLSISSRRYGWLPEEALKWSFAENHVFAKALKWSFAENHVHSACEWTFKGGYRETKQALSRERDRKRGRDFYRNDDV